MIIRNRGQLRDWKNPFDTDCDKFIVSCKDKMGRTFWYLINICVYVKIY